MLSSTSSGKISRRFVLGYSRLILTVDVDVTTGNTHSCLWNAGERFPALGSTIVTTQCQLSLTFILILIHFWYFGIQNSPTEIYKLSSILPVTDGSGSVDKNMEGWKFMEVWYSLISDLYISGFVCSYYQISRWNPSTDVGRWNISHHFLSFKALKNSPTVKWNFKKFPGRGGRGLAYPIVFTQRPLWYRDLNKLA